MMYASVTKITEEVRTQNIKSLVIEIAPDSQNISLLM